MDKIALFFDTDNLGADCAPFVVGEMQKRGEIVARLAFGDFERQKSWAQTAAQNGIQAFHVPAQNSSANALAVEAAAFLFSLNAPNIFVFVASGSDFSYLISKIQQAGFLALGFGDKRTQVETRERYNEFTLLPKFPQKTAAPPPALSKRHLETLWAYLNAIIKAHPAHLDAQGFFKIEVLGSFIGKEVPVASYGYPSWSKLFAHNPALGTVKGKAFRLNAKVEPAANAAKSAPRLSRVKLPPAQVLELRQVLEEIFIAYVDKLDAEGFLPMNTIAAVLNQRAPLAHYGAKNWQSLFKNNPILGEHRADAPFGRFKFKDIKKSTVNG